MMGTLMWRVVKIIVACKNADKFYRYHVSVGIHATELS